MNKAAKYLSGIMLISLVWLFVGTRAFSRSDDIEQDRPVHNTADTDQAVPKTADNVFIPVPNTMFCSKVKSTEKNLVDEGMRILSTGITMTSRSLGEEIIEVWLEPKSKTGDFGGKFAVVRILPNLDMSCILTTGPRMIPGGSYAQESAN